jgi:ribokinase
MAAGGKGANQAVAAARAGGRVTLVARVGDDLFGHRAIEGFVKDGIDVHCVLRDHEAPSGVALIFVGENGENSIAVAPGANGKLSPTDIRKFENVIAAAGILVLQLETPMDSVREAVLLASSNNVPVILNPAPAAPVPNGVLEHIDVLTPNEHEARLLTGIHVCSEDSALRAAEVLIGRGVGAVLITLGPRGVFVASSDAQEFVTGYSVEVVDTTGAGDVFNGTLAASIAEGRTLSAAAHFANAAAALSVTKLGAQPSIPTRNEIEAFLAQQTRVS